MRRSNDMWKRLKFCAVPFLLFLCCASGRSAEQPYLFTTVAGLPSDTFADGTGAQARFFSPTGIALDQAGNAFISETFYSFTIRKMSVDGFVSTIAGKLGVYGHVDGIGADARFTAPGSLAVDFAGNIYVADPGDSTIRKITPDGMVSTFAGTAGVFKTKDGVGTAALFQSLSGLAVNNAGVIYVADNQTIRKITPEGLVSTYAGVAGITGSQDGTRDQARFNSPGGIAVDGAGNLYVADYSNSTIRKITPDGSVTTLAGNAVVPRSQQDGAGTKARFFSIAAIAADPGGTVYALDLGTVRRITADGIVTTIAGDVASGSDEVDGVGLDARFAQASGIAVTPEGILYVVDEYSRTIRRGVPYSGPGIKFTAQPQSFTQYEGLISSLSVSVASAMPLSYQWQLEGRDIAGATNATLPLNPVKASDSGVYSVNVGNGAVTLRSAAATATVIPTKSPGAIDITFDPGAGADGEVDAAVLQPDGRIIIAGIFKHFNHVSRSGIARLEADGTLDLTFDPGLGFEGPNLADRDIQFLALQKDGKILVGGEFTKFDGTPVAGAVRLNADGKIDTNFHLPNAVIGLLALQPDEKLITRWPVTRLFSDGTPDPSFQPPLGFSDSPAVFPQAKRALALRSGKLLVVRHTSTNPRTDLSVIVPLNSDGSVDTAFSSNFDAATGGDFPLLAETANGKLMVGWGLKMGRYFADGRSDPGFKLFNSYYTAVFFADISKLWTCAEQPDGGFVLGGLFSSPAGNGLLRLSQDGSVDPGFSPAFAKYLSYIKALFCCSPADNGTIRSLAIQSDGRILIAGKFNDVAGLPRWYVARVMGGEKAAPPVINVQPQNWTAFAGQTLTLSVNASGPALFYQWTFNGTNLANATNATLTVQSVRSEDAGKYSVTITNTFGLVTSGPATVSILAPALPTIVTQPESRSVYEGTNAILFIVATNAATLSPFFQWQFNGVNISGATNSALIIPATRMSDTGNYSVLVSNIAGSVTSVQAVLQVLPPPPLILVQPSDQNLLTPTNLVLSVTAQGTGALMYQWRKDGVDLPGQTSAFYLLADVRPADSGTYNVRVSDSTGSVVSRNAIVRIHQGYIFTTLAGVPNVQGNADGVGSAARFRNLAGLALDAVGNIYVSDGWNHTLRRVSPDGNVTTFAGAGFEGSSDGIGNKAEFWFVQGLGMDRAGNLYAADSGNNNSIRKIAPDATVTTLAGLAGTAGTVDGLGTAARFDAPGGMALDGLDNIYVTSHNVIRRITPQGLVTTLNATGFNAPSGLAVDKQGNLYVADSQNILKITPRNAVSILAGSSGRPGTNDGQGSAARFKQLGMACIDNDGNLYVTDSYGGAVRKVTPDGFVITLAGTDHVESVIDGPGVVARFQYADGIAIDSNANIYVADAFCIRKGVPDLGFLTLTARPQDTEAFVGSAVNFTVSAAGRALSYRWRRNGVDLPNQTSPLLALPLVSLADAGVYEVVVRDGSGSSTNASAVLTVLIPPPPPVITTQPQSQTIPAGGSATFHIIASGLAPLTYAWRQDGTNYPPRTNTDLTVGPGLAPGVHPYSVTASDPLNRSVVSSEVTLTITNNLAGLIAHWTFDEPDGTNVFDSAGGYNGSFSGAERVPGRIGAGALRFSGTNSFVYIGGMGTSLELAGTPYTIAFWMRPVEGDIRPQSIIDKGGSIGYAVTTTNTVIYNIQANSWAGGYFLPGTNWQHFALTWDGVEASPYLNGRNNSYNGMPQLKATPTYPLILGAAWTKAGTATNWFHGDLDDVRIYNYALSQVEIQDVMGEPPPVKPVVEITQQPASITIDTASSATFSVSARLTQGSGTLNYQWYEGDGPIPWETNAIYTIGPGLAPGQYFYAVGVSAPYAIPVTSIPALLTVTNGNSETGLARLDALGSRSIEAGAALLVTNRISGLAHGNTFWTFDFASSPPAGASIDPTTGLLTWEPSLAYSPSTNVLVIRATSLDTPPQVITTNLQVVIGESIELGLGSTSMPVGAAGAISLDARFHASSDSPITNLSFILSYPPSLVTNLNVSAVNSKDVSVSTSPMDNSRVQIALNFNDRPISNSTQTVAQITFSARDVSQSAVGILSLASIQAHKLNSNRVTRFFTRTGRLIVANHVPFLDASISGTNGPILRLFGQAGARYRLESRPDMVGVWQPIPSLFLTNYFQEVTDVLPASGSRFYRAVQE